MIKRMLSLALVLILALLSCAAAGEAPQPDFDLEDVVWNVLEHAWSGEARCVKDYIAHDTYTEAILGYDHPDGTVDAVANLLVDSATGRVIYYRRSDFQMPVWLKQSALFGFDLDREAWDAWCKLEDQWRDWGIQTCMELTGEKHGLVDFFHCAEEDCALFAFCNSPHGDLHAAMICRLPDTAKEQPLLMAYVDVETNPAVGYDGCLTAEQAIALGMEALRGAYGDAVADRLLPGEWEMVIFDYALYLFDHMEEAFENGWDALDETCAQRPFWFLWLYDLDTEGAEENPDWCDQYWVGVDAYSGEILCVDVQYIRDVEIVY